MNILITNDDGIYSEGIIALYNFLEKIAKVTVVAPDTERSAVGHGITLADPIRVKKIKRNGKLFGYSTTGTPADCVKLALRTLMKKKPDLVVSGINRGPNVGYSVLYSGTVSGATEGAVLGIPSFSISLAAFENCDYSVAAKFAVKIAKLVKKKGLPPGVFLNINVPAVEEKKIKGVRIVRQSKRNIIEKFDKRKDPYKQIYYWLSGEIIKSDGQKGADIEALRKNYITITPFSCDRTDYGFIKHMGEWGLNFKWRIKK